MKNLLFILVLFLCLGCESSTNEDVVDKVIEIYISDKEGNDLLDPSNEGQNAIRDVSVYYILGDTKELAYQSTDRNEFARSYSVYGNKKEAYNFRLIGNYISTNKETSLIIEWNKSSRDTIRCGWLDYKGSYHSIIDKVYVNDELAWEIPMEGRAVYLVK